MDATPPTSTVHTLPSQTTATGFTVSATATDPTADDGGPPSGVASIAIYDSTDGGPFSLLATVTPASPSTPFTGQAGHTYGFYSVATDNAGNVQPTPAGAAADRPDRHPARHHRDHAGHARTRAIPPSLPWT